MRTSEDLDKLAPALVAFQGSVTNPAAAATGKIEGTSRRTGEAYAYEYHYASLDAVIDHVRPQLLACELAVTTGITGGAEGVAATPLLLHSSGQFIEYDPVVIPASGDPKAWGAAYAYARRYAFLAVLGLAPRQEDTDAAGVGEVPTAAAGKPKGGATPAQLGKIEQLAGAFWHEDTAAHLALAIKADYDADRLEDLTKRQASALIDRMAKAAADRDKAAAEDRGKDEGGGAS